MKTTIKRTYKYKNKEKAGGIDLTGQKFGYLEAIERFEKTKGFWFWLCICDCGNFKLTKTLNLTSESCISCGCYRHNMHFYQNNNRELSNRYMSFLAKSAKERNIEFDITTELAWKQFLKQGRKCIYTGIELKLVPINYGRSSCTDEQTGSLDRIDSALGYLSQNIQWAHKTINVIKWGLGSDEFIKWCCCVSEYQLHKNQIAQSTIEINNIPSWYLNRFKKNAIRRNIDFNITESQMIKVFAKQNGICALSGVELIFATKSKNRSYSHQTASLDRIDSSKLYEYGNIQWLHKVVNQAKWNLLEQEYLYWCNLVTKHRG